MKTNELVSALLCAETCILGAECAARYLDQARAALAQPAAVEVRHG